MEAFMNIRMLLSVPFFFAPATAIAFDCAAMDRKASQLGEHIPEHESGRATIGKGRVAFFSAPDSRCPKKGVFVLPGESLNAYSNYGKFTSVMYINLKTGDETDGWVFSSRLKATGWGMGPN